MSKALKPGPAQSQERAALLIQDPERAGTSQVALHKPPILHKQAVCHPQQSQHPEREREDEERQSINNRVAFQQRNTDRDALASPSSNP